MPSDPAPLTWTLPQRRVLLLLLTALFAFLALRFAFNPSYVSDPQPGEGLRSREVADKVDPNAADWQMLAALPGIGEKRARDIVAFREAAKQHAPGEVVFRYREDLLKVKGIGFIMLEGMKPYLIVPGPPATTTITTTLPAATAPRE